MCALLSIGGAPQFCGVNIADTPIYAISAHLVGAASDFMARYQDPRAVGKCPFCHEHKPAAHQEVCGFLQKSIVAQSGTGAQCAYCTGQSVVPKVPKLWPRPLPPHHVSNSGDLIYMRCAACGAQYCDEACFRLGGHMSWCPCVPGYN